MDTIILLSFAICISLYETSLIPLSRFKQPKPDHVIVIWDMNLLQHQC